MNSENWLKTEAFLAPCMEDKPTACAVLVVMSDKGTEVVSINMSVEEANALLFSVVASIVQDAGVGAVRVLQ